MALTIGNITTNTTDPTGGNITFTANDKQFTIFARERQ